MSVEYVGYKHFTKGNYKGKLAGGYTEGQLEVGALFADWIESGFPDDVRVSSWASSAGGGTYRMTASDLVHRPAPVQRAAGDAG